MTGFELVLEATALPTAPQPLPLFYMKLYSTSVFGAVALLYPSPMLSTFIILISHRFVLPSK